MEAQITTIEKEATGSKSGRTLGTRLTDFFGKKSHLFGGASLIVALNIGNVLNFIFNAYLGRVLSFEDFALIGLIGSFYGFISIPYKALGATVNYWNGFLIGKQGNEYGYSSWKFIRKRVFYISLCASLAWLISTPFLMNYFKTNTITLFIAFLPLITTGFVMSVDGGFMSAAFMFGGLALITLIEPLTKLLFAIALVHLGADDLTYSAIPFSVLMSFFIGWYLIIRTFKYTTVHKNRTVTYFPKRFFVVSFISSISVVMFLGLDVALAKHFLSSTDAGRYALVSLVGKMVYFLGNLTSPFIIPLISRKEGANKNSHGILHILLIATTFVTFLGLVLFGILGYQTIPLMYGKKALSILPYLVPICVTMMSFSIAKVFANYYLTKKNYTFPLIAGALSMVQLALIYQYHASIGAIVTDMVTIGILHLVIMTVLHIGYKYIQSFEYTVLHLFGSKNTITHPKKTTLTIAAIVSFIKSFGPHKKIVPVETVGQYRLVTPVTKLPEFSHFFIGIYTKGQTKVFIKTWQGSIKDINYYLLINEYLSVRHLSLFFERDRGNTHIAIPKVITYYKTKKSFSVVFEYINGKSLSDFPKVTQQKVLSDVVCYLQEVSKKLPKKSKAYFQKRSRLFYIFTLPIFAHASIILNPHYAKIIFSLCWKSFGYLPSSAITLAHRDLNQENIFLYKNKIYLLDNERIVLTTPAYDAVYLSLKPETHTLFQKSRSLPDRNTFFISLYVCLQYLVNMHNNKKFQEYYGKYLKKLYAQ